MSKMAKMIIDSLDDRRTEATQALDKKHRSEFGQFFTPVAVARFMASLIDVEHESFSFLDPGAGIGSLSAALLERRGGRSTAVTAYELEPKFQHELALTLNAFPNTVAEIRNGDFIGDAVTLALIKGAPGFDAAILNPPYKKIRVGSSHRNLIRKLGVETSNLYTCFLAGAIRLCRSGAQVVAIIPRSWTNGLYFKPFRYWLLNHAALTHIHLFDSRDKAFADDDVLQENVIIRLIVGGEQSDVELSSSRDQTFSDIWKRSVPFSQIVTPGDEEMFVHIPGIESIGELPGVPLRKLGLDVCTGPVVDFRMRDHIRQNPEDGCVPLLYATHFAQGTLTWPKESRKPNAIMINDGTARWLMPNGCYVVLRRFTSKEEKRRVVAYLIDEGALPGEMVGFENHLNVIHKGKEGLPPDIARGLAAYLNSQEVDNYFRTFSGHTQVNATDLRRLNYPDMETLAKMGREAA
jgi:hypothetical protein